MKKIYETPVSDVILLCEEEIHMLKTSTEEAGVLSGGGNSFIGLF